VSACDVFVCVRVCVCVSVCVCVCVCVVCVRCGVCDAVFSDPPPCRQLVQGQVLPALHVLPGCHPSLFQLGLDVAVHVAFDESAKFENSFAFVIGPRV
jgi:hypothetical protein